MVQRCDVKILVQLLRETRDRAAAAEAGFIEDERAWKAEEWMDYIITEGILEELRFQYGMESV